MTEKSTTEAMKNALPCPCGYCAGDARMEEVSAVEKGPAPGYVVRCTERELETKPHRDPHFAVDIWNEMVRAFEAKEDAELGAIADARAGEIGIVVDIDKI